MAIFSQTSEHEALTEVFASAFVRTWSVAPIVSSGHHLDFGEDAHKEVLDQFFDEYLEPVVDTSQPVWSLKPGLMIKRLPNVTTPQRISTTGVKLRRSADSRDSNEPAVAL